MNALQYMLDQMLGLHVKDWKLLDNMRPESIDALLRDLGRKLA